MLLSGKRSDLHSLSILRSLSNDYHRNPATPASWSDSQREGGRHREESTTLQHYTFGVVTYEGSTFGPTVIARMPHKREPFPLLSRYIT